MIRTKFVLIMMLFGIQGLNATAWSQAEPMSLKAENVSMVEMFNILQKNTYLKFVFSYDDVVSYNVSIDVTDKTLSEVLDLIFSGKPLKYEITDSHVIVSMRRTMQPAEQRITIRGVVTGPDGNPLLGATVVIGEIPGAGTATDANGQFSLTFDPSRGNTLVVSMVGMEHFETAVGTGREFNISLKQATSEIAEVVITGIFTRNKESFTGSAVTMTGDELMKMTSGNVLRAVGMLDPGFRMNMNNIAGSNPNAIPDFEMRGKSNMGDYSTDEEAVLMRGDVDTRPNQPLFVLDGIIGVSVTTIIDLDPAQIESVTLLKDAAAMVIYGSRASNGVVVVETKAPSTGSLRVSYNGNYAVQAPDLSVYDLLNAKDKLELERRARFYDERYTAETAAGLNNYYLSKYMDIQRGVDTYWLAEPIRIALSHRHGVNLEGGDNTLRYKIYAGLNMKPGVMKQTGTDTKSASLDIRYRTDKLLISNNFAVDHTVGDRTSPYGKFRDYAELNSYYRKYNENGGILRELDNFVYRYDDGGVGYQIGGSQQRPTMNPMYNTLYNQKDRSTTLSLRNAFKLEYNVLPNLRLSADFVITQTIDETDVFKPSNHTDFENSLPEYKGNYNWGRNNSTNYNLSFTASYNKVFGENNLLSVYGRYDISERKLHSLSVEQRGFPNDKMDELFHGAENESVHGNEGTTRSFGFVGTASYSYKQKYAADVSVRVDASSEFGRNNRFAPFWSGGLRWNAHKEEFIANTGFFDELVFRLTFGITGSQGFTPYQALQMYSYEGMMRIYHSSPVSGTVLASIGNPDLKWQQTEDFNAGFDFNIWNRILSGRVDYYRKYTYNTVLDFSLAPSVGFDVIKDNLGNISNNGVEASLRIMPYNNLEEQLNFSILLNGSHNRNRIEKISNALKARNEQMVQNAIKAAEDPDNPDNRLISRPLPQYVEGYSQSEIWAVRSLGIDPVSGREVFLTRDGKMTYIWQSFNQVPIGDTEPTLRGTIGFNLNWKGLSVNIAGSYQFGGQMYNQTLLDKVENANLRLNVDRRAYIERWQQPGDLTRFKSITTDVNGSSTRASSRFIMDNNELMVSSMNVSYRMERRNHKFLDSLGLSSANISLYLEDLLRFSTIKMERGIDYPFARQISMSLNLTF